MMISGHRLAPKQRGAFWVLHFSTAQQQLFNNNAASSRVFFTTAPRAFPARKRRYWGRKEVVSGFSDDAGSKGSGKLDIIRIHFRRVLMSSCCRDDAKFRCLVRGRVHVCIFEMSGSISVSLQDIRNSYVPKNAGKKEVPPPTPRHALRRPAAWVDTRAPPGI